MTATLNKLDGTPLTLNPKKPNWTNILWFSITPVATVAAIGADLYLNGFRWPFFIFFTIYLFIPQLSITSGYHRLFSHRSFDAIQPLRFLFAVFGAGNFEGSILEWASDHRRHHRYIDTDRDPYNINRGLLYAHLGWLLEKDSGPSTEVFPNDLKNDRLVMWQHQYFIPLAIFSGFVIPTGIGYLMGSALGGFAWGGLLRVVISQHCTFLINSLCHYLGGRPYDRTISARDSILMAFFAFGEGYHNFHHRFQTDYRNGAKWYHWDPSKWLIRTLSFVGWTRKLKKVPTSLIMQARIQNEHKVLLDQGVVSERLNLLRLKVETAQTRFRGIYGDYRNLGASVKQVSQIRFLQMKAELKIAKLEFKMSRAQWYAYLRTFKANPA